eukprot:gene856-954_t
MADAEHPQIACIQMSVTHNKAENIESAKTLIDKLMADMPETKLIVLPECWNSPYGTQYFREYSDPIPGVGAASAECSPSIAVLLMAAKDHNVHIIGGSIPEIDSDEKVYNTCVVCGPDGTIVAKHRKVHLFDIDIPGKIRFMESDVLTAGDAITTFDTEAFGMIGVGICYDLRFPEFAASMREKGAKVLVYPGAFNMTTGPLHWELLQRARAVDNQCFVVTTAPARVNDGGYCSWGHSTIVDPWGKILAMAQEQPTAIHSKLDFSRLDEARNNIPVSKQRRPEVYSGMAWITRDSQKEFVTSRLAPDFFRQSHVRAFCSTATSSQQKPKKRSPVRRLLKFFFKKVHPDVMQRTNAPQEATDMNLKSLMKLNAYIDMLEDPNPPRGPVVKSDLVFFKTRTNRRGEEIDGHVQSFRIELQSVPPEADFFEREYIASKLVRDLDVAMSAQDDRFSAQPAPLFKLKGESRKKLDEIWDAETRDTMFKDALYGPQEEEYKFRKRQDFFFHKYHSQILRRANGIRHNRRRKLKLASAAERARNLAVARTGHAPQPTYETKQVEEKVKVIENGFHPDLVFMDKVLNDDQRRIGIQRVIGMGLEKESDFWLLENLWKAMRNDPVPIPVVLRPGDKFEVSDNGFVDIPYDFSVGDLADFLEDNLDGVRQTRKELIESLRAV